MNENLNQTEDQALEDLFADARAQRHAPGEDLMARILADAASVSAQRQAAALTAPVAAPGLWSVLWSTLGGWGGAGGLAAATAAGVWLGVAPPAGLESLTSAVFGSSETLSLFASDDILGVEG